MTIVPLSEWYPDMHRLWLRDGRRFWAPERVGYTVHQTQGGVGIGELAYARSVANFHYWTREWERPGGYNFQIGTGGTIFEMCGWEFVGAHAPGGNRTTIGVAFQGWFRSSLPNARQLDAFGWLVGNHDVPDLQFGHRDWSSTSCPGDALYRRLPLSISQPENDDMPITDDDAVKIARAVHNQELFRTGITIGQAINTTRQTVAALAPKVSELADRDPATLSDGQVDVLAHAIADGLDDRVAARTVQLLHERLGS